MSEAEPGDTSEPLTASELFGEEPPPLPVETVVVEPARSEDPFVADPAPVEETGVIETEEGSGSAAETSAATGGAGIAPITAAERLDAWTVASAWSLAAAVAAKGLDAEKYEPFLVEARRAADALAVELPPLPASDDGQERVAKTIEDLRDGAGPQLVEALVLRLDAAAGTAARLAIDSHLLLLWYTPRTANAISASVSIQAAGEASALPPELWQPLVGLLQQRADYIEVRAAVFDLHKSVAEYFAGR